MGSSWAVLEASWAALGPSWAPSWGVLGRLEGLLEASWSDSDVKKEPGWHQNLENHKSHVHIARKAENYYFPNICSTNFEVQGLRNERKNRSWGVLKASWKPLGPSWRYLKASWGVTDTAPGGSMAPGRRSRGGPGRQNTAPGGPQGAGTPLPGAPGRPEPPWRSEPALKAPALVPRIYVYIRTVPRAPERGSCREFGKSWVSLTYFTVHLSHFTLFRRRFLSDK